MVLELSECPNCGAPLDNTPRLRCPYCGGRLWEPEKVREEICKNLKADKITTFLPQEIAEKLLVELMISENYRWSEVPKEVFDNLVIKSKKVYIPFWLFDGTLNADYDADYDTYKRPGIFSHSYKVAISATIGKRGHITNWYDSSDSFDFKDYSPSLIENDAEVEPISIEKDEALKRARIKDQAYHGIHNLHYRFSGPDPYIQVESAKFRYNKYICVLCACWELSFEYEGVSYISYCSRFIHEFKYPCKEKEKKIKERNSSSNSNKTIKNDSSEKAKVTPRINLTFFGWGCFILFCIGCIVALWAFIENSIMIAITSSIYAILSALFGISMNFKQQTEDELIKGINEKQTELNSNKNRIGFLLAQNDKNDNDEDEKRERNERLSYILSTRYFSDPQKESFKKSLENRLEREQEKKEKNYGYLTNQEIQDRKHKIEQTGKELQKELENLINSYHKKLSADKRTRFFYGVILTIALLFVPASYIIEIRMQRAEIERIENERNEMIQFVSNGYISPSVIFNKKPSEFGHLKSGIIDYILQKGYIRKESDELLSGSKFSLQYNGIDLMTIEVNDDNVSFEFGNGEDAQWYWDKFKTELESMGFVYVKKTFENPVSSEPDIYMRVGKILINTQNYYFSILQDMRAKIDCVTLLESNSFRCYSFDRIDEMTPSQRSNYEQYPIDMNDQNTLWDLYDGEGRIRGY